MTIKLKKTNTVNEVARIFCAAVKEVLEQASNTTISPSRTYQRIPHINLKPDIGCFVQFNGDYSGLCIMNFSGAAAVELYHSSMTYLGMPLEELAKEFSADEVVNSVGEMVNQVIGRARRMIANEYDLIATNNQPKAITISSSITLSIDSQIYRPRCMKLSFKTEKRNAFYVEFSLDETEFIQITGDREEEEDIDSLMDRHRPGEEDDQNDAQQGGGDDDLDIEALMAANR